MSQPVLTPGQGKDALATNPVAGRIDAEPSPLQAAVDRWLSHMATLRKAKGTVACYRQVLRAAIAAKGWTTCQQMTDGAVDYLDEISEAKAWRGATYNRNLAVFRSLNRSIKRAAAGDSLENADRAVEDDSGDGGRAATLPEARVHIRTAWIQQQYDGRASGNRALYWLCLYAQGCRVEEPGLWEWRRHLRLEEPCPYIHWTPDIQKNRREQDQALAPELAALLLAYRETVPHGPKDLVFPIMPTRTTFRADRDRAGIPSVDRLDHGFSPRSARKFFSTCMTGRGVPEKMVDFLMRHRGKVEARYYRPTLEEQARWFTRMPRMWPERTEFDGENLPDLTTGPDEVILSHASPDPSTDHPLEQVSGPRHQGLASEVPTRPGNSTESNPAQQRGDASKRPSRRVRTSDYEARNADSRPHNAGLEHPVAEVLDAIAKLLRQGASADAPAQRPFRSRAS